METSSKVVSTTQLIFFELTEVNIANEAHD